MLVALGEDNVKTIEDFAGYAADDLVGWKERKDGETNHGVTRADEQMALPASTGFEESADEARCVR
jgi:N utilization substance protein A